MAMTHLKNIASGIPTEEIDTETGVYRKLILQKSGARPAWEEVSITDITGPERYLVAAVPALGAAVDETVRLSVGVGKGGTITAAEYTPDEAITGITTNGRTLTVVNLDTATTHCTLEFKTGVNAEAGVAKAFVINSAAVAGGNELQVISTHNGTGIADPGGIALVTVKFTA